jgi:hypothetical protein
MLRLRSSFFCLASFQGCILQPINSALKRLARMSHKVRGINDAMQPAIKTLSIIHRMFPNGISNLTIEMERCFGNGGISIVFIFGGCATGSGILKYLPQLLHWHSFPASASE